MVRKNIFEIIQENYDVQQETRKLKSILANGQYFSCNGYDTMPFFSYIQQECFLGWSERQSCITVSEFLTKANAIIPKEGNIEEDVIINFLEVIENFMHLLNKSPYSVINVDKEFWSIVPDLISRLEQKMGLSKRIIGNQIFLYPENAPLERVVCLVSNESVQWELINFSRGKLSLEEKRKSLAYLATNLKIEQDNKESDPTLVALVKQACNLLNNLQIRHDNLETNVLESISKEDVVELCDFAYSLILTIVLLREQKKYADVYGKFRKLQKENKNRG